MIGVKFDDDLVVKVMEAATIPAGWTVVVVTDDAGSLGAGEIAAASPVTFTGATASMRSGDWLIARTVSPEPVVTGNVVDIPPCVTGTVVTIDDGFETMVTETADVDGWTATYTLPDAGDYRVEVASPLPAVPTVKRLVVT